ILAHAGLKRLGQDDKITEVLPVDVLVPAVSQGALGIMIRRDAAEMQDAIRPLEHPRTRYRILAERSFLRALRGGRLVPAGGLSTLEGEAHSSLHVVGVVAAPDGSARVGQEISGPADRAEDLGTELAQSILESGGAEILKSLRRSDA